MRYLVRIALTIGAATLFAGCGGAQLPVGAPPGMRPPNTSSLPRYATILPDRRGKETFEYIFSEYGAGIFDYPKSDRQIGTLSGAGGQGCTNVLYGYGKKTFWSVASETAITEYEVPDKPIKTLSESAGLPSSCAMNTSGDLAVGILYGAYGGAVDIFKNASGSGMVISSPLAEEGFDGYDNKGNLFADGLNASGHFALVELPKGSSTFRVIAPSNSVEYPGSVQWDGKHLTVFDQLANAMYQYTVSGTTATLQGTISFTGSSDCAQTWIAQGFVYCADAGNNDAEVFKYPAGGSPTAVLTGSFNFPLGVVAAKK